MRKDCSNKHRNTFPESKRAKVLEHLAILCLSHDSGFRSRHVAAICDRRGRILALGYNQSKTHPFQKRFGRNGDSIYLHAEIAAIIEALRYGIDLTRCFLAVARVDANGQVCNSKPCKGCEKAAKHFGLLDTFFTETSDT